MERSFLWILPITPATFSCLRLRKREKYHKLKGVRDGRDFVVLQLPRGGGDHWYICHSDFVLLYFKGVFVYQTITRLWHQPVYLRKGGLRESWRPRVQRLNNRKRARYVNTSADTDLSTGARGLHKGLRTEDVTSDRAAASMWTFRQSSGANGGWGRSRSSFVVGALAISLMSLSAAKASIIHLTSGMEQGVSLPGSGISQGKRWLTESFRIPSLYISS